MLLGSAIPIFGIAIDDVPDFYNQHLGVLSQKLGEMTDAEEGWLNEILDKSLGAEITTRLIHLETMHSSLSVCCDRTLYQ